MPRLLLVILVVAAYLSAALLLTQRSSSETSLNQVVKLAISIEGFEPNTPIKEALGFLEERYRLPIRLDARAFQRELRIAEPENMPVKLPKLKDVRLDVILELIAYQVEGSVRLVNGEVRIVPCPNRAFEANDGAPVTAHRQRKPLWTRLPASRAETLAKLDQPRAFEGFEPNTPLEEALGVLAADCHVNILIDVDAFLLEERLQEPENQPVRLPSTQASLRSVLAALLRQSQATYRVHDSLVLIVPRQPMDRAALLHLTAGLQRPQTRAESADALAASEHSVKAAVPDLVFALQAEQRRAAMLDRARFERTVADLDSADFKTREAAARALADQPESALRRVLATRRLPLGQLHRLERVVAEQAAPRARLVWALAEIAPREQQAIEGVLGALVHEEDPETRRQVSRFLELAGLDHHRLAALLDAKNEQVRAGAVAGLQLLYENLPAIDPADKEAFGFLLQPERYEIRESLRKALEDSSPQVREGAARSSKRLGLVD